MFQDQCLIHSYKVSAMFIVAWTWYKTWVDFRGLVFSLFWALQIQTLFHPVFLIYAVDHVILLHFGHDVGWMTDYLRAQSQPNITVSRAVLIWFHSEAVKRKNVKSKSWTTIVSTKTMNNLAILCRIELQAQKLRSQFHFYIQAKISSLHTLTFWNGAGRSNNHADKCRAWFVKFTFSSNIISELHIRLFLLLCPKGSTKFKFFT